MHKVVVVDDDPTNAGLTKMLLELDGFEVDACTTLAEARNAANSNTTAFVIDVNLARGEIGLDLLSDIRNSETAAPADTITILTSGDHRREKEAYERKADRFLLKPYPPNSLSPIIQELINEKQHG